MQSAKEALNQLTLGEPLSIDRLTVIPILQTFETVSDLRDIDEAIEEGWLEVTEVSDAGRVPELGVINSSDKTVVVFDGEELIGAKQNRILNFTVIIGARAKMIIPVTCVEQGRWSWYKRNFSTGDFAYPSLRSEKFLSVMESMRARGSFNSDQGQVWDQLSAKMARMGVTTDTGAMKDISNQYHLADESLRESFPHQKNQVGYLAFIRDGFAGGDIFPSTKISERKFHKLVRSYYLDSRDPEMSFPSLSPEEILDQIRSSEMEPVQTVGSGNEARFEGAAVQGSLTSFEEKLAHLLVFPKPESKPMTRRGFRHLFR